MMLVTMVEFLAIKDKRYHTETRLDQIALVPCPFFTVFEVLLGRILFAKSKITQGNCLPIILGSQFTKGIIRYISRVPAPIHHFTLIVDQPSQFDPHNPASIRHAFASELIRTP